MIRENGEAGLYRWGTEWKRAIVSWEQSRRIAGSEGEIKYAEMMVLIDSVYAGFDPEWPFVPVTTDVSLSVIAAVGISPEPVQKRC